MSERSRITPKKRPIENLQTADGQHPALSQCEAVFLCQILGNAGIWPSALLSVRPLPATLDAVTTLKPKSCGVQGSSEGDSRVELETICDLEA